MIGVIWSRRSACETIEYYTEPTIATLVKRNQLVKRTQNVLEFPRVALDKMKYNVAKCCSCRSIKDHFEHRLFCVFSFAREQKLPEKLMRKIPETVSR